MFLVMIEAFFVTALYQYDILHLEKGVPICNVYDIHDKYIGHVWVALKSSVWECLICISSG